MADVMLRLKVSADGQGNLSAVAQGLEKVERSAKATNTEIKSMEKTFSTGLGLGAGVAAFQALASSVVAMSSGLVSAATEAANYAEKVGRLRTSTGLANDTVQRLDRLMVSMGGSTEQAAAAMNRAQKAIAGGDASLKSLGLSVAQLRAMNPEAQFEAIAKAIMEIPNHTDRAAAAMKLFGKSGAELLPVLEQVAEGALKVGRVISDENIAALERLDDYIDAANESWKEFSRTSTAVVVRALEDITAALMDNTEFLGDARGIWDGFWNGIINGAVFMATMLNTIVTSVTEALNTLVATVASNLKTIQGMLTGNVGVLQGLRDIGAVGSSAASSMKKNFGSLFQDLKNPKFSYTDYSATGGSKPGPAGGGIGFGGGSGKAKPEMSEEMRDFEKALKDSVKSVKALSWYIENALPDDTFTMGLKSRNWSKVPMVAAEGTLPIGGVYGFDDPVTRVNSSVKETEKAIKAAAESTAKWQGGLEGIALLAGSIGGNFGDVAQVLGNIGQSFAPRYDAQGKRIAMTGDEKFNAIAGAAGQVGGLIGGKYGAGLQGAAGGAMTGFAIGGPVGAVVGGVAGGIMGLIGGSKKEREEKRLALEQINKAIKDQYGSMSEATRIAEKYGVSLKKATDKKGAEALAKQLEEVNKRMQGTQTMMDGIVKMFSHLSYEKDGEMFDTFSDPAVADAMAQSFGSIFWATWKRLGVAAVDQLRPAWEQLHKMFTSEQLTSMGFGSIGKLFDAVNDPRTRALLGFSQGGAQLMNGAVDAGYMSDGLLQDQTVLARATLKELEGQGLDANAMADQLVALAKSYEATGQALPDDLKKAMEDAGIKVLDTQLEVLKDIRALLGGSDPTSTPNKGSSDPFNPNDFDESAAVGYGPRKLDKDTMFLAHEGEHVLIIPRGQKVGFKSAMRGFPSDDDPIESGGRYVPPTPTTTPTGTSGTTTGTSTDEYQTSADGSGARTTASARPSTNQIVVAPTINASAYHDAQTRQELSRFVVDELVSQIRNNPTLRRELRDVR